LADVRAPRGGALGFILVTVALDSTGIGILIPVIPKLIGELGQGGLEQAAVIGGWLSALFAVMQFGASPVLGNLSDQFGRRPVLLASLSAFGLSYVLMGFAPSLAWLFAAQCLTGLFSATSGTAYAYVTDVTAAADRPRRFGMVGASFGLGFVIGPVLGGLLISYGTRVPFFVAAALSLTNVLFGLLVLTESLDRSHRRPFHWRRALPFGAFTDLRRHLGSLQLIFGVLIIQVVLQTLSAVWPYYTMHKLGWTPQVVGYSLGVYGISTILVQSLLTGRLARHLGALRAAATGFLLVAAGYLGYALLSSTALAFACIPLTVMGFITQPSLVSLMSSRISREAQGALQGVVASAASLAAMATPLLMSNLFSVFARPETPWYFPGAPFLLASMLAVTGSLVVLRGAEDRSEIAK
jgi:DHA1 family tetracycline resistance protein-like MFS transporter